MKPLPFGIRFKHLLAAALLIAGFGLAFLYSRADFLQNADADALLRLRGPRRLSPKILLVVVDESDIRALGGWPITRDYYGYLIHILTQRNARVIGLDVLLDSPNRSYPEHDRMLAEFIQTSGRVVLPNVLDPSGASNQVNPLPVFAQGAARVGFSNLGDEAVIRRLPLVAGRNDTLFPSFGLALAQTWLNAAVRRENGRIVLSTPDGPAIRIPVDKKGRMMLNPAGDVSSVKSVRLTELLHRYGTAPDSLDFTNRLVIMAATAPSLPVLKSTPLSSQVPAALIQAAVADNILNRVWLSTPAFVFSFVWILAWIGLAYALSLISGIRRWLLCMTAAVAADLFLSLGLLAFARMVMPLSISVLMVLCTVATLRWLKNRRQRQKEFRLKGAVEAQIQLKEKALADAEERLVETEIRLAKETAEKKRISEASLKLAEEKETAVLDLEKQVRDLKASFESEGEFRLPHSQVIAHAADSPVSNILQLVEKVAPDDIPVLIQGETGTGKELIARAIHQAGPRHEKPFVAVNCGALSESLLESELFGHEKGSFTGATGQRRGRFELARGGTIFLDEVAETTPAFQAKLLRVVQDGQFERVGGEQTLEADVRIIAAHNRDLEGEVREKKFREDLYFRLKGFTIDLPPLRNRKGDIPVLIDFFIKKYGRGASIRISDAVMERLRSNRWPGNVRELENVIRRALLLARSDRRNLIQLKDLPEEIRKETEEAEPVLYHPFETQILETLRAFRFTHSAIGQTAKALGNRDRGTITEYFRGLCFEYLALNDGDMKKAAAALVEKNDPGAAARVESKMREYMENARASVREKPILDYTKPSCFKGLPHKFHPYLQRLIDTIL